VSHYGNTCPLLDTQIATATRAIADPTFSSILCDPASTTAMSCGGDPQFLTENASFLAGKNYYPDGTNVPGQGVHYVNMNIGHGTFSAFNPARPEGLVYKGGKLVAQLHFVDGSVPGWVASPNIGWLGHLWNWLPNANLIPDRPVANGRFADCFPDTGGFGAYTCPGANGPTDREIAQYKDAHDTDPHIPLTADQLQLAAKKEQQAAAGQGGGQAASAQHSSRIIGSQYQGQWNNYYCGPAAVSEALAIKPGRFGTVDQGAAAWLLRTNDYQQTSWSAGPAESAFVPLDYNTGHPVADVLNYEIGISFYIPHEEPWFTSSSDLGEYLGGVYWYIVDMTADIDGSWPVVGDAVEVNGGYRLRGHPNPRPDEPIYHWFTISGYEDYGYATRYMDSAHSVWPDTVVGWNTGFPSAKMLTILGGRGYVY
jgi:hypothetical protein